MGSCIVLRNSILMASSLARTRFLIVLRPMTNEPHLRDRVQKCVKPGTHRFGSKNGCGGRLDWDVHPHIADDIVRRASRQVGPGTDDGCLTERTDVSSSSGFRCRTSKFAPRRIAKNAEQQVYANLNGCSAARVFRPGSRAKSGAMAVTSDTTEVVTPPAASIWRSAASSVRADRPPQASTGTCTR
jgi:hypothetical protein